MMNVTIPKDPAGSSAKGFTKGHHRIEHEMAVDRLHVIQARAEAIQIERARLKDAIHCGYEDVTAGRVIGLENEDRIDAFFSDL